MDQVDQRVASANQRMLDIVRGRTLVWTRSVSPTESPVATQTRWIRVDDLDGSPATTTVEFGLDGRYYAIDLSAENTARLRGVLAGYIEAARVRHDAQALALQRSPAPRTAAASAPGPVPRGTDVRTRSPAAVGAGADSAGEPRPGPPSSLIAEIVDIVRDLAGHVCQAVLGLLVAALDILRDQLAARNPRTPT